MPPLNATAEALVQRGSSLLAAGAAAEAARAFRAAVSAEPDHVEAHYGLVSSLREAGRLEASIGAALALTVLTPQDPRAHNALASSLRTAGHEQQAEAAAARARLLQWKMQLRTPPEPATGSATNLNPS